MNDLDPPSFSDISLSHFELYVDDISRMEEFYCQCLGFVVTDRAEGDNAMTFLSRNADEHHQLVLSHSKSGANIERQFDHVAFRVKTLAELRVFYKSLVSHSIILQSVSHGTAWSLYFLDPENNRLELFTDTPWYVSQPCRFDINFEMSDAQLLAFTKQKIADMPGFVEINDWREAHATKVKQAGIVSSRDDEKGELYVNDD